MSHRHLLSALAAIALAAGASVPAAAQAAPAVSLKSEVKVVRQVTENGATREVMEEPAKVLPGDRLLFTTRYNNSGGQPATDFVVVNPLPAAVKLARVDGFDVSVDGGKTFGALAALKVAESDGTTRAAELGDVTHVRWRVASIAPGASGNVSYFAEVR